MLIKSHDEYGLRCAIQLARSFGEGPISASRIAEREAISVEYTSKILHLFRRAKLVSALRGVQGGFRLSRSPQEIHLKEIFEALHPKSDSASSDFCRHYAGQNDLCAHHQSCASRPVWSLLEFYYEDVIGGMRLSEFLAPEMMVRSSLKKHLLEQLPKFFGETKEGIKNVSLS